MQLNVMKWCVLVLAVVHENKAAETVYPRMLESRAEDGSKIVKISGDLTLTLRKSSIFSEEFFIHSTRDGVPIAYHMRGSELEKNLYHDEERMASVHLSEEDGITIEGVLGDTLRIKPEEGRERSADGQVAHTLFDVEYADGEGLNPNDYGAAGAPLVATASKIATTTAMLTCTMASDCHCCHFCCQYCNCCQPCRRYCHRGSGAGSTLVRTAPHLPPPLRSLVASESSQFRDGFHSALAQGALFRMVLAA
nr:uncharacterized protein LOC119169776 [Rhipicephalus microplus]